MQPTVGDPDPRGGRLRRRRRRKTPGGDRTGDKSDRRRHSPTPGAAKGGCNDGQCFYHSRFGNKAHKCKRGCTYQEN